MTSNDAVAQATTTMLSLSPVDFAYIVATMLFVGLVIATTLYLKLIQAKEGE